MRWRADLLVRGADGQLLAIVEVKSLRHLSRELAAGVRESLADRGLLRGIRYLLVVSQHIGFLWANGQGDDRAKAPVCEFPMEGVVRRYEHDWREQERLEHFDLELLVVRWLNDLAETSEPPGEEPEQCLALTGFLGSIRGATVTAEALS
jgi:hypothetical protein